MQDSGWLAGWLAGWRAAANPAQMGWKWSEWEKFGPVSHFGPQNLRNEEIDLIISYHNIYLHVRSEKARNA